MANLANILDQLYNTPLLTTKENLELICSIVDRKLAGETLSDEQMALILRDKKSTEMIIPNEPGIAILPIQGSIFPKANMMTQMSGATSIANLKKDFNTLMDNENVTGILLDVDSPGGAAAMIKEMADVIWEARQQGTKPIYAIANHNAHSAGYYLASQAEKLYATPSGYVGCIGVIQMHVDESALEKEKGINRTILTIGKYKAEGNPHEPLGDEAKDHVLSQMQETYDQFVEDVARGRGTDIDNVVENFGQGRSYKIQAATKRGMIDGVKTIEAVVSEMTQPKSIQVVVPTTGGSKMAEITPEALEILGLGEDATSEDVQAAIIELNEREPEPVEKPEDKTELPVGFAAEYPEQAARITELLEKDRKNDAKLFASVYSRFEGGNEGLSALALGQVEEMHLKIADGVLTHVEFKEFLDSVASGKAVVEYGERGSERGKEPSDATSGHDAAVKLRDMALARSTEKGLSYGDALSEVMSENEHLADQYRESVRSPERGDD